VFKTVWATITGAGTTTATKFHGDVMNKINNMLNGTDVSDTVNIHSNVVWTFNNGSFKLNNPADTFSYTITPAAIAADRTLNMPLTTGTDTLATLGLAQTFSALTSFSAGSDMVGSNIDNIQKTIYDITAITSSTTISVDFATDDLNTLALAHDTTFSSANLGTGKTMEIHITSAAAQTMAFPAGWTFYGTKPTTTTAGKDSVLQLTDTTGADAGVKCVFVEEV